MTGVITLGRSRVWLRGKKPPTREDAEMLMGLWREANRLGRQVRPEHNYVEFLDKHKDIPILEQMMLGYRQLGYAGVNDDGHSLIDWYWPLGEIEFDGDIVGRIRGVMVG